jgi:hypothetical protein
MRSFIARSSWLRKADSAIDPLPRGKTRITIRLDDDVLDWFRGQVNAAGGGNYQTLINNALREYVRQRKEPLEEILRRVVREELLTYHESGDKRLQRPQAPSISDPNRVREG